MLLPPVGLVIEYLTGLFAPVAEDECGCACCCCSVWRDIPPPEREEEPAAAESVPPVGDVEAEGGSEEVPVDEGLEVLEDCCCWCWL